MVDSAIWEQRREWTTKTHLIYIGVWENGHWKIHWKEKGKKQKSSFAQNGVQNFLPYVYRHSHCVKDAWKYRHAAARTKPEYRLAEHCLGNIRSKWCPKSICSNFGVLFTIAYFRQNEHSSTQLYFASTLFLYLFTFRPSNPCKKWISKEVSKRANVQLHENDSLSIECQNKASVRRCCINALSILL